MLIHIEKMTKFHAIKNCIALENIDRGFTMHHNQASENDKTVTLGSATLQLLAYKIYLEDYYH